MEEDGGDDSDQVLVTLRHSRKAYFLEYLCSFFLFSLGVFSLFSDSNIPNKISLLFLGLGILGAASTELRRYYGDRYKVMRTKLSVIKGVLKVRKRNIYYQPLSFVPDLNLRQSALQRVLGYGTIFMHVGNAGLELRDIDNPNEIIRMLEGLIEKTKSSPQNRMNMPPRINL